MRNSRGLGLVEPLVALGVLLAALVPLVAGLGAAGQMSRHGRRAAHAAGRAEAVLERVSSATFETTLRAGRSLATAPAAGEAPAPVCPATAATQDPEAFTGAAASSTEQEPGLALVEVEAGYDRPAGKGRSSVRLARLVSDPTVALRGPVAFR